MKLKIIFEICVRCRENAMGHTCRKRVWRSVSAVLFRLIYEQNGQLGVSIMTKTVI